MELTQEYPFKVMPLPYAYNALEPYIDEKTMRIHHDGHYRTYVENLNDILKMYEEFQDWSLFELLTNLNRLPVQIRKGVRDNAGGVLNHDLFWLSMAPGRSAPTGNLQRAIDRDFGSMGNMMNAMTEAGKSVFGSGWAWLVTDKNGKLSIVTTANQDNPISQGLYPVLPLDVWEHAYYLKNQNRRGEYIENWRNVINWNRATRNYDELLKQFGKLPR